MMVARMTHDELTAQISPSFYNLAALSDEDCEYNDEGYFIYPPLMNLNFESFSEPTSLCLLDDGFRLYLFVGAEVSSKTIKALFGVNVLDEVQNPLESEAVGLN